MENDWDEEFRRDDIPYADDFVHDEAVKRRVRDANRRFNAFYTIKKCGSCNVKFDHVIVIFLYK